MKDEKMVKLVELLYKLGGGFKYCSCSPLFGEDIHFD